MEFKVNVTVEERHQGMQHCWLWKEEGAVSQGDLVA